MSGSLDVLLKEILGKRENSVWEAAMFASGISTSLKHDQAIKYLKKGLKSNIFDIKRAAIAGLGFLNTLESGKLVKKAYKAINDNINDSLSELRLVSAISSGKLAFFTSHEKMRQKILKDTLKSLNKHDPAVLQGSAISIGLLSNFLTEEDFLSKFQAIIDSEMDNPSHLVLGLTLTGMGSKTAKESIVLLKNIISKSDKFTKRTAAICFAYLISLLNSEERIECLDYLITNRVEYHSKLGTDTAIILSFFRLMEEKAAVSDTSEFLARLEQWRTHDSDYDEIYKILGESNSKSILEILHELSSSSQIDVRIAGINSTFILEKGNMFNEQIIDNFIINFSNVSPLGFLDNFLIIIRLFSLILYRKDYSMSDRLEPFYRMADSRSRKFGALSYACLLAMKGNFSFINENDFVNLDEDVQWGYLVGLGLYERLKAAEGSKQESFIDELLLGLLLLDIGQFDESIPLLLTAILNINK
ncbi:MAG: hypothetical protein ACXAEU_13575 [Candidatus Hodarchaeales archaeon]